MKKSGADFQNGTAKPSQKYVIAPPMRSNPNTSIALMPRVYHGTGGWGNTPALTGSNPLLYNDIRRSDSSERIGQ